MNARRRREPIEINIDMGSPGCGLCAHLLYLGNLAGTDWKCRAFPDGIPQSFLLREFGEDHREYYPGDRGYRYKGRVIMPEGKTVGYYFDWDGTPRDAETNKSLTYYDQVR